MITKRIALMVIFGSMLVLAMGYASAFLPGGAPRLAAWLFAFATAALMVAMLALGASRKGVRLGRLAYVFGFCFFCLIGGFSLALLAPEVSVDARLWLGLPGGAAAILYVVGFLPMLVLPIAYALTFEKTTMSAAELADIRERLAALRRANPPAAAAAEGTPQ